MSNTPTTKTLHEELEAHGLGPHELHLLARALSCSESDAVFEDRLRMLAILGLAELADWIIGRKRFDTVSESDISRVLKIFLEIRQEAPSLESLANDFGISEARGHSMLSRMNYGEARRMKAMFYTHTADWLRKELKKTKIENDLQDLTVDAQCLACIKDAAWEIMSNPLDREKGGKYEGAMRPEVPVKERQGAIVHASPKMWGYITAWIDEKAKKTEGIL
jgi:DNA-binding transcriptional regulator YhcF (GntR family)